MDALEVIRTRRSVRQFQSGHKLLSEEQLNIILEAGMLAPSAGNQQPWHFIVVKDRELLQGIPTVHPYAKMCNEASLALIVCGDHTKEKHKGFWVQDCSAATQNILLAIRALGLGAVWVGVFPREERVSQLKTFLNIPTHLTPLCIIPIGYPTLEQQKIERFDLRCVSFDNELGAHQNL